MDVQTNHLDFHAAQYVMMNLRFFVALLLLCPCTQAAFVNACGYGFKCPPYRIVSSAETFEIRHYSKSEPAFPPIDQSEVPLPIALWITWQEHGGITAMTDFAFLVEYTDRVHPPFLPSVNSALSLGSRKVLHWRQLFWGGSGPDDAAAHRCQPPQTSSTQACLLSSAH